MKNLTFILQSKGGVGKSALIYLLANKVHQQKKQNDYLFFDLDNESKTSLNQLQFANVRGFNLINPTTKNIDRSLLDDFFNAFIDSDFKNVICDLGATTSEQFNKYLSDEGTSEMFEYFKSENIEFNFITIIAGNDSFKSTFNFAAELLHKTKDFAVLTVAKNNLFSYSQAQYNEIDLLCNDTNAKQIEYSLSSNSAGSGVEKIKKCMLNGQDVKTFADTVTNIRFNKQLEKLSL